MNRSDQADAQNLALAIVDTLPEPFLVLDETLHLLAASRCFYEVYGEDPPKVLGRSLFDLSDGQWDIPGLRQLLRTVVPEHIGLEAFEFEQDFRGLGKRTVQLNALPLREETGSLNHVPLRASDLLLLEQLFGVLQQPLFFLLSHASFSDVLDGHEHHFARP